MTPQHNEGRHVPSEEEVTLGEEAVRCCLFYATRTGKVKARGEHPLILKGSHLPAICFVSPYAGRSHHRYYLRASRMRLMPVLLIPYTSHQRLELLPTAANGLCSWSCRTTRSGIFPFRAQTVLPTPTSPGRGSGSACDRVRHRGGTFLLVVSACQQVRCGRDPARTRTVW